MPDVFLRPGEPAPNDVKLRDPTLADAGSVTVSPAVAALLLAGLTPTVAVSDNQTVSPGVATLVLTPIAPTVTTPVDVSPSVGSLVLTGATPTVTASDHKVVTPGTVALVLSGVAPTVTASDHKVVSPGVAALALTAFAPTVTASAHVLVAPSVGALHLSGLAPTVTATSARRFAWLEAAADAPVVAEALMENLVTEYGDNRGKHVYFAMEREQKGPFAAGNKYDATERAPQPVVVVQSSRPNPNAPAPAANAPKAAEDTLRAFVRDANERMGFRKLPPPE